MPSSCGNKLLYLHNHFNFAVVYVDFVKDNKLFFGMFLIGPFFKCMQIYMNIDLLSKKTDNSNYKQLTDRTALVAVTSYCLTC